MDDHNTSRKVIWGRLGGQLGVGLCAIGFLLVFLGWNGAASVDRIPSQFPYLISGGVAGLCFVILGVGMLVVQNQRTDRAALQDTIRELQAALERGGLAEGSDGERQAFARPGPRPVEEIDPRVAADDTVEVKIDIPAEAKAPARRTPLTVANETTTAGRTAKAGSKSTKASKVSKASKAPAARRRTTS